MISFNVESSVCEIGAESVYCELDCKALFSTVEKVSSRGSSFFSEISNCMIQAIASSLTQHSPYSSVLNDLVKSRLCRTGGEHNSLSLEPASQCRKSGSI